MGRWSAMLAPRFIAFAGVREGDTVLDVGCGTGVVAAAVARAHPACRVIGVDLSAPYVAAAEARHGSDRVRFEVGDAQQLPIADARVDRTLSMLNMNFLPDAGRALTEMRRVTRAGGCVAAAVWDYGDGMEMLRIFWDEAVALHPSAEPRDERRMPFCRTGELAHLWSAHGLTHVESDALTIETRFSSFEDYWAPFLEGQGPAGALVSSLSPDARDRLLVRLRARLVRPDADGPILLRARAWAVRGLV